MGHKNSAVIFAALILLVAGNAFSAPAYRLHSSISQFSELRFLWETTNYFIRIDDMGNNSYRYSVWPVGSTQSDEPDLVLYGGIMVLDGTGGNHHYVFTNDEYSYRCDAHYLTDGLQPPGTLVVYRNSEEILREDVVKESHNFMIDS
ncbi:MAG: hypothetical protein K8S62_15800 [Candidatus Sabulitectum sp.]|nr:hypothetical protein [Candidatus Sabulitectum sp.]